MSQPGPKGSLIHELRTPLTQVIGFAELLAEEAEAGPPRDLVPALRRIAQAGRRLTRLLDEHFGRPGDGPVELPPLQPADEARLRAGFERRSRRLRELLERFLGDEVMAQFVDGDGAVRLLEATVLCAELRSGSERGDPARELQGLNRLLEPLLAAAADARGSVLSLGSEGLMVLFGFPEEGPDDTERAVRAALRMQLAAMAAGARGGLAVGLDRGRVAAGTLGTARRAGFGAVGRPVGGARRLAGLAAAGQILASGSLLEAAGHKVVTGGAVDEATLVQGLAGLDGVRLG
jgi:class 3 adenylate cyclase